MIHNVKAGKLYKGSILIDNEKLVYCRVYAQDYNTDQEAELNAKGIAKAINNYDSLLEHLKAVTNEYQVALELLAEAGSFAFHPDQNNLIINSKQAIKNAEQ